MTPTAEIDLAAKVAWLRRGGSLSDPSDTVEAIATHFAWVFLSKRFAYKLKKPLRIRDMDFTKPLGTAAGQWRERTSWYLDAATGPAERATSRRAAR
jgi:hypothetical protein